MRILKTKETKEFKDFQCSLIRNNSYILDVISIRVRFIDRAAHKYPKYIIPLALHHFIHRINKLRKASSTKTRMGNTDTVMNLFCPSRKYVPFMNGTLVFGPPMNGANSHEYGGYNNIV